MIPIARPADAPAVLCTRGADRTALDRATHDAGRREFEFDRGIYNGDGVKERLLAAQAGKCAFCESLIRHVSFGDVEHYRPKGRVAQDDGDPPLRPGYYWLAYEWANLFLACQVCNQSFKRDLFPLRDPTRRARSHHDDLSREEPLLLDPCRDDPRPHIGFEAGRAVALADSTTGEATIRVAGLNRPELVEKRRRALRSWGHLRDMIGLLRRKAAAGPLTDEEQTMLGRLLAEVADLVSPVGEYSAMAAAFFGPR